MPGYYDSQENPILIGHLRPGKAVTIRLVLLPDNVEINLDDNTCSESQVPGYYYWPMSNVSDGELPAYPEVPTILYVMEDEDGHEFSGKVLINSWPEEVRRDYRNTQTLL